MVFVVAEERLGLDPVDDGSVDGDRDVQLDVRRLVVTAGPQVVLVLTIEKHCQDQMQDPMLLEVSASAPILIAGSPPS